MDGPALELTVTSPLPDIFRFRVVHLKGYRRKIPQFELQDKQICMEIEEEDNILVLVSGETKLVITKKAPCSFTWYYRYCLLRSSTA